MGKSIEEYRAELISKGMLVAANRLVAPSKPTIPAPVVQPRVVSEVIATPAGMLKVWCASTKCRNFEFQPKGQGKRFVCADHDQNDEPLLYYRGHLYTPHIVSHDGVAFKLRNGRTITLEPSKVEWSRPPKY